MTRAAGRAVRFGPLGGGSVVVNRSGLRWLCPEGHLCRPGEVIAYCNITVETAPGPRIGAPPFAEERTLQVALAPRAGGRVRPASPPIGGLLDAQGFRAWDPTEVAAYVDPSPTDEPPTDGPTTPGDHDARLLMLAGRHRSWTIDVDTGLLPGWHLRARAWWGESGEAARTLVSAGLCDARGAVRGDRSGFVHLFEAAPFGAQIVHVSEHPTSPCATTLLEAFRRTPSQLNAVLADLTRGLGDGRAGAEDWMFLGALAAQLAHSPLRESQDVLTPHGLERRNSVDAILLSVIAEPPTLLRHRALGYHLNINNNNRRIAGPAVRAWLTAAFEPVTRSLESIRDDYVRLIETVGAATGARFLILNRMSTSGREDVSSYAAFDAPMGQTLTSIAGKEMNLLLEDLAESHGVLVVDIDAIAAELGGARHLPDGVHQSGPMQARVREEMLSALASVFSR